MDSNEAAELFKAADEMKDWFVSYWQKIAKVLEVVGQVFEEDLSDEHFRDQMVVVCQGLKVVDPIPRLTALDKAVVKWRSLTMGEAARASWVSPKKGDVSVIPSLMKEMIGVNTILTLRLWDKLKEHALGLNEPETTELVKRLHEMTLEAAPWLANTASIISDRLEEECRTKEE